MKEKALFIIVGVMLVVSLISCNGGSSSRSNSYSDETSGSGYYSSGSSSNSMSSDSHETGVTGAGGYDMPNESDESFSDYVKRVDPELYDTIQDRYDDATSGY